MVLLLLVLSFGSCTNQSGNRAFEAMIACRDEFTASFSTIASGASILSAKERLRLLVEAVKKRQECEHTRVSSAVRR